jgi:hypothetical protein
VAGWLAGWLAPWLARFYHIAKSYFLLPFTILPPPLSYLLFIRIDKFSTPLQMMLPYLVSSRIVIPDRVQADIAIHSAIHRSVI